MNNIINKKNFISALSMILFLSSSTPVSTMTTIPTDCIGIVCGFIENQKDIFNGLGLSCKKLKFAVDNYMNNFDDGRHLDIYCSKKNSASVLNLLKRNRINHDLIVEFVIRRATEKELKAFLENETLKRHRIKKIFFSSSCHRFASNLWENMDWKNVPNLEIIILISLTVSGSVLNKILSHCCKLKEIVLNYNKEISCDSWENIDWKKVPDLKKLGLRNTNLGLKGLKAILLYCNKLEELGIYGCDRLSFFSWNSIDWEKVPNLKILDAKGTGLHCTAIEKLCLSCEKIQNIRFKSFWLGRSSLINNKREIEDLAKKYPHCKFDFDMEKEEDIC